MVKIKEVTKDIEWKDIHNEKYRIYEFPKGKIKIKSPILLNVSKSGGHRILDEKDVSHYIPSGWIHLYWETIDNVAFLF